METVSCVRISLLHKLFDASQSFPIHALLPFRILAICCHGLAPMTEKQVWRHDDHEDYFEVVLRLGKWHSVSMPSWLSVRTLRLSHLHWSSLLTGIYPALASILLLILENSTLLHICWLVHGAINFCVSRDLKHSLSESVFPHFTKDRMRFKRK